MNADNVDNTPRIGEQRPGGRAARVRNAVLHAAAELLTEVGYETMSVEEVATRAGVHKTTVYRRWPTKASLTADAASLHSADVVPIPDTGSIVGDLKVLAHEIVANIGTEGGARRARSITAASATSDELAAAMHGFWANRLALTAEIVKRAIERGELPRATDANLIIESVIGPLYVRLLLTGEAITEELADQIVDIVLRGATPR